MKKVQPLQTAREMSGKTQAQAAADLNMSVRSYQNYEYGMSAQTIKTAIRIAELYNTTVEKLWGGNPQSRNVQTTFENRNERKRTERNS